MIDSTNVNNLLVDNYKEIELLGKGSYGKVYLARHTESGNEVAIKVVDMTKCKKDRQIKQMRNEQEVCELKLQHPSIVNVYKVIEREDHLYFVLEYLEGGELYHKVKSQGNLSEKQAKVWFRELLEGIAYLHKHGIVHRDLKPENVLFDKDDHARLCDFGFATKIHNPKQLLDTYCGSPFYAAPEMVTGTPYRGPPSDMWSSGVILYNMLTGTLPFLSATMPSLFSKIKEASYYEPTHLSSTARHLIRSLLCKDPKRRFSAQAALKHPWFKEDKQTMASFPVFPVDAKKRFDIKTFFTMKTASHPFAESGSMVLPSPQRSVTSEELASYRVTTMDDRALRAKSRVACWILSLFYKKATQVEPASRRRRRSATQRIRTSLSCSSDMMKKIISGVFKSPQ